MYPNLLIDSTVKDLLTGADLMWLINEYNDSWITVSDDKRLGNDAVTKGGNEAPALAAIAPRAPAPAFALIPALVHAPAAAPVPSPVRAAQPVPHPARETQPPLQTGMQTISTKSRGRPLRLPRPPTGVSAGDEGLCKRATVGRDWRMPKARRVEFAEGT
jgi:hypothetical protein